MINKDITIFDNERLIKKLIKELVLDPRIKALEWAKITNQTPNIKIGYPGQHLASLITGVKGARTGARGDDLIDGSEVKSCSRVDQVDTCKDCKNKVSRMEMSCSVCSSANIDRKDDSKWLFSIKHEDELELLTQKINRIFLTIADYPNFAQFDYQTIRFQAFEIWNNGIRHSRFKEIMTNYYYKIFLEHIKLNPRKTPAPKNFWPYSYQFYLCNPIKVFSAIINKSNTTPEIEIEKYIEPHIDRTTMQSEDMPTDILNIDEVKLLIANCPISILLKFISPSYSASDLEELISKPNFSKNDFEKIIPKIPEEIRNYLELRDTDKISTAKNKYSRR